MHHLVACVFCGGMDPNADSLLLQAAIAGGITAPWMLRNRLRMLISRFRGRLATVEPVDAACQLPTDEESPTSER
jgi:hypothetical protein